MISFSLFIFFAYLFKKTVRFKYPVHFDNKNMNQTAQKGYGYLFFNNYIIMPAFNVLTQH
jgi:hypothetical protein